MLADAKGEKTVKFDGLLLEKLNRITAWASFILMAVFMATGFGSAGMWGVREILGKARCDYWHNNHILAYLLILFVLIHSAICLYRTLKRYKIL